MLQLFLLVSLLTESLQNFTEVDLTSCKLTHAGTEYMGRISKTEMNLTCQYWASATQKGSENIVNEGFPEGSKSLAKNYCRNPTGQEKGPWCYTNEKNLFLDVCEVPLCVNEDCRITGPGMEYSGSIQKSASGKPCTEWHSKHKLAGKHKEKPFGNFFFPDGLTKRAGRKCRNPDSNIAGPWCYVEDENADTDVEIKELCDVPYCDDLATIMYSEGSDAGHYHFFTTINTTDSLQVKVRLWNPADWVRGQIFMYISAYDIAADREEIEKWKSGLEILVGHSGSGFLSKEDSEMPLTETPLILSGAKWTELEINWTKIEDTSIIIQVFQKSKKRPIAIKEIIVPETVFQFSSFKYFSIAGSPCFVDIVGDEDDCEVHTAPQLNFTRFWLIKQTVLGMNIEIFVRANEKAKILLRQAPMITTDQIMISIGDKEKIQIAMVDEKNKTRVLKETTWPKILNFWAWQNFKITLFKEKLQVFWIRTTSTELVIEHSHPNFEKPMWFSFGSPLVSYWTIYCNPRGVSDPPAAVPPECVSGNLELFNGTLSVTKKGEQCLPWVDNDAIPEKYQNAELFVPYGGKTASQNFCRNLDNDPRGAFCFVKNPSADTGYSLEYCQPRSCSSGECKIAGTDNDYLGKLNITRSKRECLEWTSSKDSIVNVTNFPDPSLADAKNFCRNPSKSATGAWCFTTDANVTRDLCFIKDCDKPLQCTILTAGFTKGSNIFILPRWRKYGIEIWLKAWNPDIYEGLIVVFSSLDLKEEYTLLIGDDGNERVKLFYKKEGSEILLEHKTLPHLVPTGKWGGYWIRPGIGKIEFGYDGVPMPFFEWSSANQNLRFEPMFINFGTINGYWIGVNLPCTECLTEQTNLPKGNKMYPVNLWGEDIHTSSLLLNLRGNGSAIITLMWTPDFNRSLAIHIISNPVKVVIVQYNELEQEVILASFPLSEPLIKNQWSKFNISFTEDSLTIYKSGELLVSWASTIPLLFYWFSVSSIGGVIIWSANCPAEDIDGEPRDGHWGSWGPWSCSVSCGKGIGRIERACNNPPPNVYGKECKGSATYEGICNDFPCGEISPGTLNLIRQYLSTHYRSIEVESKEKVELSCNPEIVSLVTAEVSSLNITWTHNGVPYSRTKFYMDDNYNLVIPQAQEKHNGVYLCTAYQDLDTIPSKIVIDVVALIVTKQKPTKKIRKGRSMTLKCNGLALSYVYADLSQRWELNGTVWKEYGLGALEMYSTDKVENITFDDDGNWTCVIAQEDLKFKWTTNWINLKVNLAPTFWSYLMEDVATAPLFSRLGNERNAKIVFFVLMGGLVGVIILITAIIVKCLFNR